MLALFLVDTWKGMIYFGRANLIRWECFGRSRLLAPGCGLGGAPPVQPNLVSHHRRLFYLWILCLLLVFYLRFRKAHLPHRLHLIRHRLMAGAEEL